MTAVPVFDASARFGGAENQVAAATKSVWKSFGASPVLRDVSITIPFKDTRGLVGRNGAGKSTLVGILTGILAPTSGSVELGGEPAPPVADRAKWRQRVACVYQRWTVIPSLTIAENLFLNNQPLRSSGAIDWTAMREQARSVLLEWGLDVDPTIDAGRLAVDQRQIVEIGRALLQGSRFIILDEPTAELERREVHQLFDRLKGLQENGVTFVYISHHLEELYEICRSVTVLRDGAIVADAMLKDLPRDQLVRAMVGSQPVSASPSQPVATRRDEVARPVLEIDRLVLEGTIRDVSLEIRAGECVGLAGLATSGKEEIGEILAGLLRPSSGAVRIDGKPLGFGKPLNARDLGVGYVPRDRHHRGILPQLSLAENLTATVTDTLGRFGFIMPARRLSRAKELMNDLSIVASSPEQPISQLSGGNQQKGLMGRALASGPKLLVLVGPTQGVDIASKNTLFAAVARARAAGTAVLVISDELDELSICDRLLVMFHGRVTAELGADRSDHQIVAEIEGLSSVDENQPTPMAT
jgi:simple sugar transport system ATP-binding protein